MKEFSMSCILQLVKESVDISERITQDKICNLLFYSYVTVKEIIIDKAVASRWFTGRCNVPKQYWNYYHGWSGYCELAEDISCYVFPIIADVEYLIDQLRKVIHNDPNMNDDLKEELLSEKEAAPFLALAIVKAMEIPVKNNEDMHTTGYKKEPDVKLIYEMMECIAKQMKESGKNTITIQLSLDQFL